MVIENIVAGIITAVIYGLILLGDIVPIVFIARTKHNIAKYGYKKYIIIIAGLEVLLLLSAVLVLFLLANPFYSSIVWNKQGINMELFIMLYQLMLEYILPVYLLIIVMAGRCEKWKRKYRYRKKEKSYEK